MLVLFIAPGQLLAKEPDSPLAGIHKFLEQNNFELAISTTRALLKNRELSEEERFKLLRVLAEAEEIRATAQSYASITLAIRAYKGLHEEFPGRFSAAEMHWKVASLNWSGHEYEQADATAQFILQNYPLSPEAKQAALLHSRILIKRGQYAVARGVLLTYFGLGSKISAQEEDESLVWLAVIDQAEGRSKQAFEIMKKIHTHAPATIENDALPYATYIHLIAQFDKKDHLLTHIDHYIKLHVSQPEALSVRLLQGDILVKQERLKEAGDVYGILADRYGESSIGKKALMRQLVIRHKESKDTKVLQKLLGTLAHLAATNQLSDIEAEAQLYQARIMMRLTVTDHEWTDQAIVYYALAASSEFQAFASDAKNEGTKLLQQRLQGLLAEDEWLQAAVLWKQYPQLHPYRSEQLAFGIARAYIHLMDFTPAEKILNTLHGQAGDTIWSQRIILEKARLWSEREDADGVDKIMHWLIGQEHTLYRQDLLLIAAHIQTKQGDVSTARQTLAGVTPENLTPELQGDDWRTHARINIGLKRWHIAAAAWEQLAKLTRGEERWLHVRAQAEALVHSEDYRKAEDILMQIPDQEHDAGWQYTMALCAYNTGRRNKAEEHLQAILSDDQPNSYTIRARLALAEQRTAQLKGMLK